MEPIFELSVSLPPKGSRDLLRAVHGQIRAAIIDGRLQAGLRLPSTRALADSLGVSRNTIVATYDLLLSEGYLVARPGAGTYVADGLPRASRAKNASSQNVDSRLSEFWRKIPAVSQSVTNTPVRYDFRIGLPDKASFPFPVWRRLSARALRGLSKTPAAYADPEGQPALREAIARHVSFA